MNVNNREAVAAITVMTKIPDLIATAIVAGDWSFDQIHFEVQDCTIYPLPSSQSPPQSRCQFDQSGPYRRFVEGCKTQQHSFRVGGLQSIPV